MFLRAERIFIGSSGSKSSKVHVLAHIKSFKVAELCALEHRVYFTYMGGCQRVKTTDAKCRNGKVPMVIRSHDVISALSARKVYCRGAVRAQYLELVLENGQLVTPF